MINIVRDYEPMDLEDDIERFEEDYDESIEYIHVRRDNLVMLMGNAIQICQWWSFDLTQENKKKSIKALRLAAKSGEAIFRLGLTPEKKQKVVIDDMLDATYDGQGLLKAGFLNAMDWQKAFFCAAIVRDKDSMDSLVKFPVSLMRQCSTKNPEAEYVLTELIQSIYRHDPHEKFITYLKKAGEEITRKDNNDLWVQNNDPWVQYGTKAKLDFIIAFITNHETTPSDGLASALTLNWNYCELHRDHEYQQPDFYMPIQLLGLACMAKDLGKELNVQSDFIPQFYIDGDYL